MSKLNRPRPPGRRCKRLHLKVRPWPDTRPAGRGITAAKGGACPLTGLECVTEFPGALS
jgi:hypothetical protein